MRPDDKTPKSDELRVTAETPDAVNLEQYGAISIAFTVNTRFAVRTVDNGLGGLLLVEEVVEVPYVKDYDLADGEGPASWPGNFDMSRWVVFAAFDGERRVGGAVVAWNTGDVDMLEGRADLAELWDIRVAADQRGRRGVGHRLFSAAADWARERECRELKVETQNINVAACRFYARQGCELKTIRQGAYPEWPDEAQLLWYKQL